MDTVIDDIVDDLVRNWGATVTRVKTPKWLIYLDDVEYKIPSDKDLIKFYEHFCGMLEYS